MESGAKITQAQYLMFKALWRRRIPGTKIRLQKLGLANSRMQRRSSDEPRSASPIRGQERVGKRMAPDTQDKIPINSN
jgi:hypothetical protein